jgi:hypothetical protein
MIVESVPLYKLRYPWYVILEYVNEQWPVFRDDVTLTSRNLPPGQIFKFSTWKGVTVSVEEQGYVDRMHITFNKIPILRTGVVGHICTAIKRHFSGVRDLNGNATLKEYIDLAFRGKEADAGVNIFQTRVNAPFRKIEEPVTAELVTPEIAEAIFSIAFYCAEFYKRDLVQQLSQIRNEIEDDNYVSEPGEVVHHNAFWSKRPSDNVFEALDNTHWIQFERTESEMRSGSSWGLATASIFLDSRGKSGFLTIKCNAIYGKAKFESSGLVSYDFSGNTLVAQLIKTNKQPPTQSFFFMSIQDPQTQKDIPGYYLYFSSRRNRYVVKKVLWSRRKSAIEPTEYKDLNKGEIDAFVLSYFSTGDSDRVIVPPVVDGHIKLLGLQDKLPN